MRRGKERLVGPPQDSQPQGQHYPFKLVFFDLMGPITPEALEGYTYVSKISSEHPKWTNIFLLKSKGGALSSFQTLVQSVVIPSGSRVKRLRTDRGGEYISNEYNGYCLQTGVSLEYATSNTPQQICISERVGQTLVAIVRCLGKRRYSRQHFWATGRRTQQLASSPHSRC